MVDNLKERISKIEGRKGVVSGDTRGQNAASHVTPDTAQNQQAQRETSSFIDTGSAHLNAARGLNKRGNAHEKMMRKNADEFKKAKGDPAKRKGAARAAILSAMRAVAAHNAELGELNAHALTSDVSTETGGAVFWAGHDYHDEYSDSTTKRDAMHSAHNYAEQTGKLALEQTPGGAALEDPSKGALGEYKGLAKRFKYLAAPEEDPSKLREGTTKDERTQAIRQKAIESNLGNEVLAETSDQDRKDLGKSSAAGGLWNRLSKRFAEGASGEVTVVHGISRGELYEDDDAKEGKFGTTWLKQERPQLLEKEGITGITTVTPDESGSNHGMATRQAVANHQLQKPEQAENVNLKKELYLGSDRAKDFGPERPERPALNRRTAASNIGTVKHE